VEADIAVVNALVAAITTHDIADPEMVRANARSAIRAAATGDFGVSAGQLRRRAERLSPDNSEIIVLFENLWERRLTEVARQYQGTLAEHWYIPTATLARLGQGLSDAKT
jgi:hypothetical protein